ncbi:HAD family hydrolase [Nocardioides sp. Root1257]|uniref:HAD-IIA family hydrolase n=1 Tax=unclassified Nocardioides TaxID=2615069 RepID=UPI0006F86747|nr:MULTISPECIES: HAD-IIA family hydrolase [unclassified Nocardioides]KQW49736.1 HAD family hydrolase [Nocardioides sp. Root1257]KRC50377.1 HAD family hydrolase [Nocardioides sp. Root224]
MLGTSEEPLCRGYDLAMLDLDGVVYISGDAVPGAAEHLASAREEGMRLAFITNNAARSPETVASHLRDLGVDARGDDVVTSAQAAARVLVDRFEAGARVVCLGSDGLEEALRSAGLDPVGVEDEAVAVVTGYGPEVRWSAIMRAAVRIRDGLPWVASNTDHTIPTAYGVAPGHGVQVAMLRDFTGVEPVVAGKPERPLLDETIRRVGGRRPLMVGDRLDTDIEGARRADIDSLLVLTGVTGLAELTTAAEDVRPTYVAPDLAGLLEAHGVPVLEDGEQRLGGWRGTVAEGRLRVDGDGSVGDWWRVVAATAWQHLDDTGEPVDLGSVAAPAAG